MEPIENEQPVAAAANEAAGENTAGIEQEIQTEEADVVKQLFQGGFKAIYEEGQFDTLMTSLEDGGDMVEQVSMLLTTIMDDMIKTGGITDVNILLTVGMMLMTDLLGSLEEVGISGENKEGPKIIAHTVKNVLSSNPEMGQAIMKNPQTQQLMEAEGIKGPQGPPQAGVMPQPNVPAPGGMQ